MSLLIKALKQAERDHQARSSAAPAAEAAPAAGLPHVTLQLDPIEPATASAPLAPAGASAHEAPGAAAPAAKPSAPVPTAVPTASAATDAASHVMPIAGGSFAAGAPANAADRAAQAPPEHVRLAAAAPPAGQSDRADLRQAARQLMAPDPDRQRLRRRRLLLAGGVGTALALAIGLALWQFAGLGGLSNNTPGAARVRLASVAQPAPTPAAGGPSGKVTDAQKQDKATARPQAAGAAAPKSPAAVAVPAARDAPAQREAAPRAAADPDAEHAAGAIRLRPPEVPADKVRALLQDAYGAAARGDAVGANKAYERVIEIDRNSGDAWIGLATLAANNGDAAGANQYFRRALDIDPSDSVALAGLLGLQTGVEPQEYEARLRQFIARDGAQPVLLAALGKLLARQGRWLEAQEVFFQAWTADPSQADVAFNLAVSLERIRQPEVAVTYYRRALQLAHERAAHFDLALANDRIAALAANAAPGAGAADDKAPAAARQK